MEAQVEPHATRRDPSTETNDVDEKSISSRTTDENVDKECCNSEERSEPFLTQTQLRVDNCDDESGIGSSSKTKKIFHHDDMNNDDSTKQDEKNNINNNNNNSTSSNPSGTNTEEDTTFDCHICLDRVNQPVLSLCGHLYCWPCIYEWLLRSQTCPVCKSGLDTDKLVPLYGRGRDAVDPRKTIPERPQGTRSEPPPQPQNPFDSNMFFSFGFPFMMGFQFQYPPPQAPQGGGGVQFAQMPANVNREQQQMISRLFIFFGLSVLLSLILN